MWSSRTAQVPTLLVRRQKLELPFFSVKKYHGHNKHLDYKEKQMNKSYQNDWGPKCNNNTNVALFCKKNLGLVQTNEQ